MLRRVSGWIQDGERVALTCYEREPAMCHRNCVGDAILQSDSNIESIEHL